jgi:hypothetical protein
MGRILESLHAGTMHLTDEEFLEAFESCTLPGRLFNHADHIRLARLYVLRLGDDAGAAAAASIRRYADHQGASHKYHETITQAWMALVAAAISQDEPGDSFETFAGAHPGLFERDALYAHYSKALLASQEARAGWVPPDVAPLP